MSKTIKGILTYATFNSLYAASGYYGVVKGVGWSLNVFTGMSWLILVLCFIAWLGLFSVYRVIESKGWTYDLAREYREKRAFNMPVIVDVIFDLLIITTLVLFGQHLLAGVLIISLCFGSYAKFIIKKLDKLADDYIIQRNVSDLNDYIISHSRGGRRSDMIRNWNEQQSEYRYNDNDDLDGDGSSDDSLRRMGVID